MIIDKKAKTNEYKSPPAKLLRYFHDHRDAWRKRAKDYHQQLRQQAITIRDLTASRDHWRAKYFEVRHPEETRECADLGEGPCSDRAAGTAGVSRRPAGPTGGPV